MIFTAAVVVVYTPHAAVVVVYLSLPVHEFSSNNNNVERSFREQMAPVRVHVHTGSSIYCMELGVGSWLYEAHNIY